MTKKRLLTAAGAAIGLGALLILAAFAMAGFNLPRLDTSELETQTYELTEPFAGADIRVPSSDVRFALAEDGKTRVESRHDTRLNETVEVRDGTLTIEQKDGRRWYEHVGIFYGSEDESVTVYLAEGALESLSVKTASGDIEVPEVFSFLRAALKTASGEVDFAAQSRESLAIETVSGDIKAAGVSVRSAGLSSTSGEIEAENLNVTGTLEISTVSGDVRLESVTAGDARLKTTSGEAELRNTVLTLLDIQTVSGDVTFERSDAGAMYISTTSGEVGGALLSPKQFEVRTTSGSVRVPDSVSNAGRCVVTTTSGDVSLRIVD